jgi:Flp pilus assembly protein TadB
MNTQTLIVALAVCVILPVLIVWIALRARQNEVNRKADLLLKAMEAGIPIDQELLKPARKARSVKQGLLDKLTGACVMTGMGAAFLLLHFIAPASLLSGYPGVGCIFIAIGIALFISYFVGKNMLAKEIEAEEKELDNKAE